MPKYFVVLTAVAQVQGEVVVEADSPEAARAWAEAHPEAVQWRPQGLLPEAGGPDAALVERIA
ncbi:MAG: hypothetical protein K6U87_08075 [Firmicutes bacterium]|nr:hypothetical protein [Bacillota bacterium]